MPVQPHPSSITAPRRPSKGIALVLVVGILGTLVVLGTAFVTLARLERHASQQRTHATRAFLLARSGLEDGMARMAAGQDPLSLPNRYAGEDLDLSGNLNGAETDAESYRPGFLNVSDCPLSGALKPSWSCASGLVQVDGRGRGRSGGFARDAAHYAVKASQRGGFYVNGGDIDPGDRDGDGLTNARDLKVRNMRMRTVLYDEPNVIVSTYNSVLLRMLGTLAEALDREIGPDDGLPVDQTDGENLILLRPPGGWTSYEQIREVALGGDASKLEALQPYLTLSAWVDRRVIRPGATNSLLNWVIGSQFNWGDVKSRRYPLVFEGMESPTGWNMGRAPVDLAWARTRRPALLALLAGLHGQYMDGIIPWFFDSSVGAMQNVQILNDWTPACDASVAADAFLSEGSADLDTWQRFNAFCDGIPFAAADNTLLQAKRDLLKANFNPNGDLNKFNPNPSLWRSVDKSDLLIDFQNEGYSTEFSLLPLQGFELQSLGRVLDGRGRLLAQRRLTTSLAPPAVFRLSTQQEFVCEDLGSLDAAGDEREPRLPGFSVAGRTAFLSQSQGMGRTWGHTLDTTGLSPAASYASSWMNGSSLGTGLQTYPEPCHDTSPYDASTGLSVNPAWYDGNLQLATIEIPADTLYVTHGIPPGGKMTMLARFDDGFDLDLPATAPSGLCIPSWSMVTTAELGTSLLGPGKLNTLYPDGAYAENGRIPSYLDRGNCDGWHGVISFWVKPGYLRNWAAGDLTGRAFCIRTNASDPRRVAEPGRGDSSDQFFWLGDAVNTAPNTTCNGITLHFETGHSTDDLQYLATGELVSGEEFFDVAAPQSHVWSLVTAFWDFRSRSNHDTGRLLLDRGTGPGQADASNSYWSPKNLWAPPADVDLPGVLCWCSDITLPDDPKVTGSLHPHHLSLGRDPNRDWLTWFRGDPDSTLDEFVIYDFGGAPEDGGVAAAASNDSLLTAAQVACNRHDDGRYYKGDAYHPPAAPPLPALPGEAGSYVTAPIRLPAGVRLSKLAWTWHRPSALPDDYAELELVDVDMSRWSILNDPDLSRSTRAPRWTADRQDWDLALPPDSPFRIRILFERLTPVPDGTPILDSPVFDDITLLCRPIEGARITGWSPD